MSFPEVLFDHCLLSILVAVQGSGFNLYSNPECRLIFKEKDSGYNIMSVVILRPRHTEITVQELKHLQFKVLVKILAFREYDLSPGLLAM